MLCLNPFDRHRDRVWTRGLASETRKTLRIMNLDGRAAYSLDVASRNRGCSYGCTDSSRPDSVSANTPVSRYPLDLNEVHFNPESWRRQLAARGLPLPHVEPSNRSGRPSITTRTPFSLPTAVPSHQNTVNFLRFTYTAHIPPLLLPIAAQLKKDQPAQQKRPVSLRTGGAISCLWLS